VSGYYSEDGFQAQPGAFDQAALDDQLRVQYENDPLCAATSMDRPYRRAGRSPVRRARQMKRR
jgi:hypothetical protein